MVVAETETLSEAAPEVPGGTTARARVPAVTAVRPAWGLAVEALEEEEGVEAAVEGADKQTEERTQSRERVYEINGQAENFFFGVLGCEGSHRGTFAGAGTPSWATI